MMAYIQILAIVLCSCFIQDAFSVTKVRRVTSAPANDAAAFQLADAGGQAAAIPPVKRPTAEAGGQVASMPPVRRPTTVKRTVTRKPTAAPAPPPPPPPPPAKYPNLTAVKDMFWNAFEDINRNENGKLNIRSARNMLNNVLRNKLFWSSVVGTVRRRVKETNDSKRADGKIRMCNALTSAITSPNAMQGFQDVANEVYGTVSRIQSDVGTDALRLATEMVKGGEVNRGLSTITSIVNKIKLSPRMLIKGFAMLRKTLNLGGTIHMGGGLARGIMTFTSKFNK